MNKTREGDDASKSFPRISSKNVQGNKITCTYYLSNRAYTMNNQEQTIKLEKNTYYAKLLCMKKP
jgi:hypothetical protein